MAKMDEEEFEREHTTIIYNVVLRKVNEKYNDFCFLRVFVGTWRYWPRNGRSRRPIKKNNSNKGKSYQRFFLQLVTITVGFNPRDENRVT